jgi:hypothetical protein
MKIGDRVYIKDSFSKDFVVKFVTTSSEAVLLDELNNETFVRDEKDLVSVFPQIEDYIKIHENEHIIDCRKIERDNLQICIEAIEKPIEVVPSSFMPSCNKTSKIGYYKIEITRERL